MRVPVKSERDAFRIALGVAVLIGAAVVLTAVGAALYGIALAAGGAIAIIAWDLLTQDADRRQPLREAALQGKRARGAQRRILVIANETLAGTELRAAIAARSGMQPLVRVVAPVLPSRMHYLTSDIDSELADARRRLDDTLTWAHDLGLEASGRAHPDTPITAIEDELRTFGADELIISTHPPARSRWLETGLVDRARKELDIPVTHVVVDLARAVSAADRPMNAP